MRRQSSLSTRSGFAEQEPEISWQRYSMFGCGFGLRRSLVTCDGGFVCSLPLFNTTFVSLPCSHQAAYDESHHLSHHPFAECGCWILHIAFVPSHALKPAPARPGLASLATFLLLPNPSPPLLTLLRKVEGRAIA